MQGPRTPEPQVAVIVGRGCEKLAEIEKRTGAKIALTRPAADRFREITLQGPDAVRMPTPRFIFFFSNPTLAIAGYTGKPACKFQSANQFFDFRIVWRERMSYCSLQPPCTVTDLP